MMFTNCFAGFVAEIFNLDIAIPAQPGSVALRSVFGWITIHQHVESAFNWQRLWTDYRNGFGSSDGHIWLGLEKLHQLTRTLAYRLRVFEVWAYNCG